MGEAWIYGERQVDPELTRVLAELGFAPRRVAVNGSLRPEGDGGGAVRPPELALVVGGAAVCARLGKYEDLGDVPVLVAVDDAELEEGGAVHEGHELIVLPLRPGELRARIARARRRLKGVTDDDVVRVGTLE